MSTQIIIPPTVLQYSLTLRLLLKLLVPSRTALIWTELIQRKIEELNPDLLTAKTDKKKKTQNSGGL